MWLIIKNSNEKKRLIKMEREKNNVQTNTYRIDNVKAITFVKCHLLHSNIVQWENGDDNFNTMKLNH